MRAHTLTLNPALDLSGHVDSLLLDEKNYVHQSRLDAGGNGVNSARMMARLGISVTAFGFLGGFTGKRFQELLALEAPRCLRQAFTKIGENTRIGVTVTNDSDHHQTRLTFPSPELTQSELLDLLSKIQSMREPGVFVLGGSVPSRCSSRYLCKLLDAARARGQGLVVDVPSSSLNAVLSAYSKKLLLVKPNRLELEGLVGSKLGSVRAILHSASQLLDRCSLVCVSLGAEGAMLVSSHGAWFAEPVKVKARGCVGAGDSMVGGMVTELLKRGLVTPEVVDRVRDHQLRDVLAWGTAAGAATAETEGTILGSTARVQELVRKVKIRPIKIDA